MTVDTQKLRELQARATPGPLILATSNSWRRIVSFLGSKPVCVPCTQPDGHPDLHFPNGGAEGPDAALLIESRNALPALLDEIDRLRAELQQTASMLQSACLVISDPEARAMALQQVKEARAVLNPPAPPQGEKE